MERVPWEYRVISFVNAEIPTMQETLAGYGRAGWELVSMGTTVKHFAAVNANEMVAVLKRPGTGEVDVTAEPTSRADVSGWL